MIRKNKRAGVSSKASKNFGVRHPWRFTNSSMYASVPVGKAPKSRGTVDIYCDGCCDRNSLRNTFLGVLLIRCFGNYNHPVNHSGSRGLLA